jgi:linoleoyl-CoA desaturase
MVFKTIFMFSLYFVPYYFIYQVQQFWVFLLLMVVMGLAKAGLGLSVMHDANHGSYSNKKWVNQLLSFTMNIIGGNATNWKIQHNVFHHTYTNIDTHDEDIRPRFILRFSPNAEKRSFHRYQYLYAWILYGLMTISWLLYKDFLQLRDYQKSGVLAKHGNPQKEWAWLLISKSMYIGYIMILPMVFTSFAWWQVLIGFFVMHYITGFILAIIFQPAHVLELNEFPQADDQHNIEENWSIHQLKTTCNFAQDNRFLTWYAGGLNYQVEHHLFPNICHVHYRKLSKIVRNTAKEFNLPYHSLKSFREALVMHGRMLYQLGN